MGRRHRHLNPVHCGAQGAFDARFIPGAANNAAIQTWDNRANSSNNATQSNALNRPTFIANGVNGQPIVRFDRTTPHVMNTSGTIIDGSDSRVLICAYRSTTTGDYVDYVAGQGTINTTATWFAIQSRTNFVTGDPYIAGFSRDTASGVTSPDNAWKIGTGAFNSPAGELLTRKNGVTVNTRTGYSYDTDNGVFRIGLDPLSREPYGGDIAAIIAAKISHSLPLVRRMEQSLALSFKLPCG